MNMTPFFPPGAEIVPLPKGTQDRLYIMKSSPVSTWQLSGLYPAFRLRARAYKLALRAKTLLGLGKSWYNSETDWLLGSFTQTVLPEVETVAVLVGTPGPAQKITVQLWDDHKVIGYLKYATKSGARGRLAHEHKLLTQLPRGLGPDVLKYGTFAEGVALITAPLAGKTLLASLPPHPSVHAYLKRLRRAERLPIAEHPFRKEITAALPDGGERWLDALASRDWPVTFLHGDFAPWNLFKEDERVRSIDWEYGSLDGLPHLDLCYYLLQVACLVRSWSPRRAAAYTLETLRSANPTLSEAEAKALTALSAVRAHYEAKRDGQTYDTPLQAWRRQLWEGL